MFFPYVLSSYLRQAFLSGSFQSLSSFSPVVAILLVCVPHEQLSQWTCSVWIIVSSCELRQLCHSADLNNQPKLGQNRTCLSQLLGNRARLIFSECEEVHWNAVHSSAWVRNPQRIGLHFCLLVGFRTWNLFAVKFIQIEHLQQKAVVKVGEVGWLHTCVRCRRELQ